VNGTKISRPSEIGQPSIVADERNLAAGTGLRRAVRAARPCYQERRLMSPRH
jgi:hypothetical protein